MVPDKKGQERTIELSLTSVRERVIIIIILRVKNTYEKNINLIVAPSEIKKKTVFQNNTY
jgi:hypothetical protein